MLLSKWSPADRSLGSNRCHIAGLLQVVSIVSSQVLGLLASACSPAVGSSCSQRSHIAGLLEVKTVSNNDHASSLGYQADPQHISSQSHRLASLQASSAGLKVHWQTDCGVHMMLVLTPPTSASSACLHDPYHSNLANDVATAELLSTHLSHCMYFRQMSRYALVQVYGSQHAGHTDFRDFSGIQRGKHDAEGQA